MIMYDLFIIIFHYLTFLINQTSFHSIQFHSNIFSYVNQKYQKDNIFIISLLKI